jgi:toxin YoeB
MQIELSPQAKEDVLLLKKAGNKAALKKIEKLIESILETPFEGIGKPEPLKHQFSGCWSRRIDKEHRLVYEVDSNKITILSLKGHYA